MIEWNREEEEEYVIANWPWYHAGKPAHLSSFVPNNSLQLRTVSTLQQGKEDAERFRDCTTEIHPIGCDLNPDLLMLNVHILSLEHDDSQCKILAEHYLSCPSDGTNIRDN